jgi:hypothetical protein
MLILEKSGGRVDDMSIPETKSIQMYQLGHCILMRRRIVRMDVRSETKRGEYDPNYSDTILG